MALSLMAFLALFARCRLGQGFPRARSLGTLGILGGLAMAPPSLCFPSQALDAKDSWDGEIVRIEHAIRPGSSSAHMKASPASEPGRSFPAWALGDNSSSESGPPAPTPHSKPSLIPMPSLPILVLCGGFPEHVLNATCHFNTTLDGNRTPTAPATTINFEAR